MYTLEQLQSIHDAAIVDFQTAMRTGLNSVPAESAKNLSGKMIERMKEGEIPDPSMLEELVRKSIIELLDHDQPSSLLALEFLPEGLIAESLFDDPNDSRVNGENNQTVKTADDSAAMFAPADLTIK